MHVPGSQTLRHVLLFIVILPTHVHAADHSILLNEAIAKWKVARSQLAELSIGFSKSEIVDPAKPPLMIKGRVLRSGPSLLIYERAPFEKPGSKSGIAERVLCQNETYGFTIVRNSDANPYVPTFLGRPDKEFSRRLATACEELMFASICVHGTTMVDWINRPGFVVKSADIVDIGNKNVLRLNCSYTPSGANPKSHFPEMDLQFDRNNNCCLLAAVVQVWYGKVNTTVEYNGDSTGTMAPTRIIRRLTFNENGKAPTEHRIEFNEWSLEKIPSSEFSISRFGLSEPEDFPRPTQRRWQVIIVVSSLVIATVYLLKNYRRKFLK